jgi:pimeloyl-ACP methyl ester carboxylesterase
MKIIPLQLILVLSVLSAALTIHAQPLVAPPAPSGAPAALPAASSGTPAMPPANFKSTTANVNGVDIHYVIGGKGEPLVLVHGFGQNWYMWNRLLPELSKHFTVIAPDLRGVGESGKPAGGYDKKTMATDIYALVKKLGYDKINLAGHDIGLMVVYAYAAQYPSEVKKLAFLDALIPGIEPSWSEYWAKAWWWGFFPHQFLARRRLCKKCLYAGGDGRVYPQLFDTRRYNRRLPLVRRFSPGCYRQRSVHQNAAADARPFRWRRPFHRRLPRGPFP